MVATKFMIGMAALSAPLVAGHGYMGLPKASFPKGGDITSPAGTIDSSQWKPPSGSFTTDPTSNTNAFTAWIATSEYKSLKALIVAKGGVGACGNSALADPQPLPDQVEWTHGSGEGFTPSHEGPCEVWCDDKMAFHNDNCAKNYPSAPAKLPIDKTKCAGAKSLTTYWLALHSPQWQVYIGCAALSGSGGGSAGNATPAPATTSKPTVKPSTPSAPASTPAPAPDTGNEDDCDEDLPEPDADCDEDLPEPDCDDDLPEPSDGAAGEADGDCDEDLPEPDCDDDLPEPGNDADCDEDLPEPDCDDLPEPETGADAEVKTSDINFGTYKQRSADETPGTVEPEDF